MCGSFQSKYSVYYQPYIRFSAAHDLLRQRVFSLQRGSGHASCSMRLWRFCYSMSWLRRRHLFLPFFVDGTFAPPGKIWWQRRRPRHRPNSSICFRFSDCPLLFSCCWRSAYCRHNDSKMSSC